MTTDRLPWLLLLIALATLVVQRGCQSGAVQRAEAAAAVHEERASEAMGRADSLRTVIDVKTYERDSLASAYTADSLRWAAADAENRARIARTTERANRTLATLSASLDSVQSGLLAEYTEATDSVIALKDAQIADLTAERSLLWARMETMDELVEGLTDEALALRETNEALRSANDALRRGLRSADRQKWLKIGAAALAAKAAYDFIRGG